MATAKRKAFWLTVWAVVVAHVFIAIAVVFTVILRGDK